MDTEPDPNTPLPTILDWLRVAFRVLIILALFVMSMLILDEMGINTNAFYDYSGITD